MQNRSGLTDPDQTKVSHAETRGSGLDNVCLIILISVPECLSATTMTSYCVSFVFSNFFDNYWSNKMFISAVSFRISVSVGLWTHRCSSEHCSAPSECPGRWCNTRAPRCPHLGFCRSLSLGLPGGGSVE